jgi:hypothetical protein
MTSWIVLILGTTSMALIHSMKVEKEGKNTACHAETTTVSG